MFYTNVQFLHLRVTMVTLKATIWLDMPYTRPWDNSMYGTLSL